MSSHRLASFLLLSGVLSFACSADPAAEDQLTPDAGAPSGAVDDAGVIEDPADAGQEPSPQDAGSEEPADAGSTVADAGSVNPTPDAGTPPPPQALRFVALGDAGKGNAEQAKVGLAMAAACETRGGCSFALYLGDNFYPTGVSGSEFTLDPNDPTKCASGECQWWDKFEKPYSVLTFPFYVALGNHDYGGNGAGWEFWLTDHQLEYARNSTKWRMPARHYSMTEGVVDFFALDTNAIFWGRASEQEGVVPGRIAAATKPWKIAYGHHPYLSNGTHGNAGRYDGLPSWAPFNGKDVKKFVEDRLCGKVDVYLAGHDHNMQDLGRTCGTEFLVSGAGASTTPIQGSNPNHFQSDASGFLMLEATEHTLAFTFFDQDGHQLHTRTISK